MRAVRAFASAALGCLAAVGIREDRRAEAACRRDLVASIVRKGEQFTPESVREALERAGPDGLSASFELLGRPEPGARAGAALFLGLGRSRLAAPRLIRLLRDPEASVRRAAATALGAIGERSALPFLHRAIANDGPDVAEAALLATRSIRASLRPPPEG
jgi:HEAT repeat protein